MTHQAGTDFFVSIGAATLVMIGIIWISVKNLKRGEQEFVRTLTFALLLDILSEPALGAGGALLEAVFHVAAAAVICLALWRYSRLR